MTRTHVVRRSVAVLLGLHLSVLFMVPPPVSAQQASGIAGEVRDDTGGVLPGVTVTVASPALIERQRVAITDGQGRYNITDLRPGVYSVTFALPGFSTIVREGITLTAGFSASVDAEMQVGGIEETITVTGASPVVDVQNVRRQTVVSDELLSTLPSGSKGHMDLIRMIPGMTSDRNQGGGGAMGIYATNATHGASVHGKGSPKAAYNGMEVNNLAGDGSISYIMNPSTAEETSVETAGIGADSNAAGLRFDMIPKEGGNSFSSISDFTYTNDGLQGSNLTEELIERGVTVGSEVLYAYDVNLTLGGPIRRDRLWFFTAARFTGSKQAGGQGTYFNLTQGTPLYTPDLSRPTFSKDWLRSLATRVTWQATSSTKISGYADPQTYQTRGQGRNRAPEAQVCWRMWPQGLYQGTWTWTPTSRLLFEAGGSLVKNPFPCTREDVTSTFDFVVDPTDVSIQEATTGFVYNAATSYLYTNDMDRWVERFSVSYVTGSHAFKTGFELQQQLADREVIVNQDVNYRFRDEIPERITQFATPYTQRSRTQAELGIYAQDQWTIDRLTLNLGVRFEYQNGYVPAQEMPATQFVPARSFPRVDDVPNWIDLNPRLGVSYDLFGTGRTALKASLGRYVGKHGIEVALANDPITTSVNSANRSWSDTNGDYVPDCDLTNFDANGECGPISNANFGASDPDAVQYDEDLVTGFGTRDYFWDMTVEVQHEVSPQVSLTAGWYRNWSNWPADTIGIGDIQWDDVTDNLAITPADFDPYCITAPAHPDLPGGGGYELCGLYDITPDKFGVGEVVVTRTSDRSRTSDFITVSLDTRLDGGGQVGGSLDVGRTVEDKCFVIDSPQQLLHCRVERPWAGQTQIKLYGTYPLPGDFVVSGVFQNTSGVDYQAIYQASNDEIAPSLGRNLAACGTQTVCNASVAVPLIAPGTQREPRVNSLDLRVSKLFSLGNGTQLRANLDVYNVTNASNVMEINSTFGPRWRSGEGRAGGIMVARLIQFGAQVTF